MNVMKDRRIVITGVGTINPVGSNVKEFWRALIVGKQGIRTVKNCEMGDYQVRIAGEVDLPDLSPWFRQMKMTRQLDRYTIMSHIAGTQAYRDAGIDTNANPARYGVVIATGVGGHQSHCTNIRNMVENDISVASPYYVVACIPNTASGFMGMEFNLQGPNFSINSACASSAHAIGMSILMIKAGMADAMFAGGSEAVVNAMGIASFGNIGALSQRNDDPATASRPFDRNRDGFVMAEGASVLCLEELDHAKKRGARIYAEITGFGTSCDAYDLVMPHHEGRGARIAMNNAIADAGINKDQIDLINAHGTSTPVGDLFEGYAIQSVFEDLTMSIPVHSTKSLTGHLIGAAGSTEVLAALLAIDKKIIHRSLNVFEQDEKIKLNVVTKENIQKEVNHVISNSFGFGGQNASLVISRFNG
jgi:3-oxoacyl-[acyl-carrier-protein] synthase II